MPQTKEDKKAWRDKNRERLYEQQRRYKSSPKGIAQTKARQREYNIENRARLAEKNRQYRAANLDRLREWDRARYKNRRGLSNGEWLWRKYTDQVSRLYGLSREQYNAMALEAQGHCAICNEIPDQGRLDVDHNHRTGKPRGLLCRRCNLGVFYLEEREWMSRAHAYLSLYGAKGKISKYGPKERRLAGLRVVPLR